MKIDQQIKQTECEIEHWKEVLVNRKKAHLRAAVKVQDARFTIKVWEDHLQILKEEAGK